MLMTNLVRPRARGPIRTAALVSALIFAGAAGTAAAQDIFGCGSLDNAYGPFDYTNPVDSRDKLPIVEKHHYDLGVQMLKGVLHKSNGQWNIHNDLDYTLRAFPNHHGALYTTSKYYLEKVVKTGAPRMRYTPECYFERAMRWRPNDATVRMIYGLYLHRAGQVDAALERYREAVSMAPNSAEIHYNIGLLYESLKDYDRALDHAHRAYELGYPLPGLRNMLQRAGKWTTRVAETEVESVPEVAPVVDIVPDSAAEEEPGIAADETATDARPMSK